MVYAVLFIATLVFGAATYLMVAANQTKFQAEVRLSTSDILPKIKAIDSILLLLARLLFSFKVTLENFQIQPTKIHKIFLDNSVVFLPQLPRMPLRTMVDSQP